MGTFGTIGEGKECFKARPKKKGVRKKGSSGWG